ncbi:hypothetical protein [Planotetraspora sp. GP83]|uniref:hypothetical protein n=1 Tax=Planotetraspora sp. GP83 TaxID=3156264 RepID=UPI003516BDE3
MAALPVGLPELDVVGGERVQGPAGGDQVGVGGEAGLGFSSRRSTRAPCTLIDPEFGNAEVLVGVWMDGVHLEEQGPHLVVPGDRCGGRHISRIVEIRICADARLWGARG